MAREGHDRSAQDVTIRRQRKTSVAGRDADTTTVELETHSSAGNPHYLAVEQHCDEFAAHLLGLNEATLLTPADPPTAPTTDDARLISALTTDTLERVRADLTRPVHDAEPSDPR